MKLKYRGTAERIIVLCLATAFALPNSITAQGDASIEPGLGVGVLRLGLQMDEIQKRVSPSTPSNQGEIKATTEYVLIYIDLGLKFYFKDKKLERILIINPKLIVRGSGIHVGDDYSKVKQDKAYLEKLGIIYHPSENMKKIVAIEVKKPND